MDVLGMSLKEFKTLPMLDYLAASEYVWMVFNQRRMDMGDTKPDPMSNQKNIDWSKLNPVSQELERQKREIPQKMFMELPVEREVIG